MRRFSLPFALVVVLAAAVAFAVPDRVVREFAPLGASAITGEARLNPMPQQGSTKIQARLSNLDPDVEYVALVFEDGTCSGLTSTVVAHFTANNQGKGGFNELINQEISLIGSVSIARADDQAIVLACTL